MRERIRRNLVGLVRERAANRYFTRIGERPSEVEGRHARVVVDLVLRMCELGIATGSPASDVTGYGVRVAAAFGVTVHIDITTISVTISYGGSDDDDPVTTMRLVQTRTQDYHRLAQLEQLIDEIVEGRVEVEEARSRFAEITQSPRTYRGWVMTAAMAMLGGAFAVIIGGSWEEVLAATLVTALVDVTVVVLGRRGWSLFFIQASGAGVATLAAIGLMALQDAAHWLDGLSPGLVVAAGIVSLLTGLSLVSSSRDALDGFYVTAAGGLLEVAVATAGIVVGVTTGLWVGLAVGVPLSINTGDAFTGPIWLGAFFAGLLAVAIGIGSQVRPRDLGPFLLIGALAWTVEVLTNPVLQDRVASAGAAALAVGAVAQLGHHRWKIPVVALVAAGVVPLLPGLTLYRGLYGLLQTVEYGGSITANSLLLTAVAIAGALAIGSSLGAQLMQPLSRSLALPRLVRAGLGGRSLWRARPAHRARRGRTGTEGQAGGLGFTQERAESPEPRD